MNGRCPFCWNRNVSRVAQPDGGGGVRAGVGRLMECGDCEKWYWSDTGEEVVRLFEICATSMVNPGRCLEEVREMLKYRGNGFPRYRTAEFNRICSDCLSARFISRRADAHV